MTGAENTSRQPELVLLHGWGLGSAVWQPALPALAQRFTVRPFNLPGYRHPETEQAERRIKKGSADAGVETPHEQRPIEDASRRPPFHAPSSPTPQKAPPVLSFARTAEVLAEALPQGCIICGWSLGGLLAMQTAGLAPQRFKALILVGSTPRFTQADGWPHAQPAALLSLFNAAVARNPADVLQRFISLLNQGDVQARSISRAMIQQLLTSGLPDTPTLLAGLDWLRDVDLRCTLPHITTPTLLIHGEHDPLMPLPAAQWLAQHLPDARLEVVAGAAHAPFANNPEAFAGHIAAFCHALALD